MSSNVHGSLKHYPSSLLIILNIIFYKMFHLLINLQLAIWFSSVYAASLCCVPLADIVTCIHNAVHNFHVMTITRPDQIKAMTNYNDRSE